MGVEPEEFWAEAVGEAAWRSALEKYGGLAKSARLAGGERGAEYRRLLTGMSKRWPGALREGELIGPQRVEARRRASEAGVAAPLRARGEWEARPARAALCWAELHLMISDQLAFRRARRGAEGSMLGWEGFASWLGDREGAQRWPLPLLDEAVLGPKLAVRSAYLCLAARAGLGLPELNELLFARSGHWDRRAEDPAWAHA